MEKYIDKIVRVKITDGRVIEGQLKCIDNDLNMILLDSFTVSDNQPVGTVLVPGEHLIHCHLRVEAVS